MDDIEAELWQCNQKGSFLITFLYPQGNKEESYDIKTIREVKKGKIDI
ncbi:MAG: hypothetical protein JKX71_06100 [Amylibacter sp.]|nr:hypothetical protein [Amylibacter sp.]